MSELRLSRVGRNARQRLPVFLCLQGVRRSSPAEAGRLLRLLFLWNDSVSAGAVGRPMFDVGEAV
jgi:hypothetical protein